MPSSSLYKDKDIPSYRDVKANLLSWLSSGSGKSVRSATKPLISGVRSRRQNYGDVVVSLTELSDMLVMEPAKPETAEAVPVAESGVEA